MIYCNQKTDRHSKGQKETREPSPCLLDVDTDGGNGQEMFIWEALLHGVLGDKLLHSKINHRVPVIEKVCEFLGE